MSFYPVVNISLMWFGAPLAAYICRRNVLIGLSSWELIMANGFVHSAGGIAAALASRFFKPELLRPVSALQSLGNGTEPSTRASLRSLPRAEQIVDRLAAPFSRYPLIDCGPSAATKHDGRTTSGEKHLRNVGGASSDDLAVSPPTFDIRRHFSFRETRFTKRGWYVSCVAAILATDSSR
jgi:hypothetical protein